MIRVSSLRKGIESQINKLSRVACIHLAEESKSRQQQRRFAMVKDGHARCDDCGFLVGTATRSAHGSQVMHLIGVDSNCNHPPAMTCPHAKAARDKARATAP